MNKVVLMLLCLLASIMGAKAQIGYQIALLNTATGEARASETVTVSVSLSNSANEVFYTETKQATTNDFGVLSLTIGNADTFANVDLTKMPFFIEVTANGVLIGKSQMLSVPVAEVAKRVAPTFDSSLLVGTWKHGEQTILFLSDGTGNYIDRNGNAYPFNYEIIGNMITLFCYEVPDNGSRAINYTAFYYDNQIWFNKYYKFNKQQ